MSFQKSRKISFSKSLLNSVEKYTKSLLFTMMMTMISV